MTQQDKLIKNKLGLLRVAEHLGNVSETFRTLRYSRDTFYRIEERVETGDTLNLQK